MIYDSLEKRIRAEALILQAQQQLKLAALDFGMQFAPSLRQRIETLIGQLEASLIEGDEIHIQQYSADLQFELNELDQQVRQQNPPNF